MGPKVNAGTIFPLGLPRWEIIIIFASFFIKNLIVGKTFSIRDTSGIPPCLRRTLKSGLSSTDITNLETLRQEPFVLFTDIDGTSHYVNLKFTDDLISNRIYANRNVSPDQTRLFTLEMTEVKTT